MNDMNVDIDAMSPCPIRADPEDAACRLNVPTNHGLASGVVPLLGSASSMVEVPLSPSPILQADDNVNVEMNAPLSCDTLNPPITLPRSPPFPPDSASILNNDLEVLDPLDPYAIGVEVSNANVEKESSVPLDEVNMKRRVVVAAWRIVGHMYVSDETHVIDATEGRSGVEEVEAREVELTQGESASEEVEVEIEAEQHLLSSVEETIAVRIDLDIPAVDDCSEAVTEHFPVSISTSSHPPGGEDVTSRFTETETDVPEIPPSQTIPAVETATACVSDSTAGDVTQKAAEAPSSVLIERKTGPKGPERTLGLGTVQGELEKVFELRRSARARMISSSTQPALGSDLDVQHPERSFAPLTPNCHKSSSPNTSVFRIPSRTLSTTTISAPQCDTEPHTINPKPEYITENITTAFGTRRVRRRVGVIPPMTEGSVTSRDPRIQMELSTLRAQKKVGRNVDGFIELKESNSSYSPRLGNGSSSLMFRL